MMKRIITTFFTVLCILGITRGQQATNLVVYQILQQRCAGCHSHTDPEAGLDLEGAGATVEERAQAVRNNIVGIAPANTYASGQGFRQIYPGRTDRSYLFRKINGGLEPTFSLSTDEGEQMPPAGEPAMSNEEKELIRQWILFGAPETGEVVDPQVINDYYNVNGLEAFATPPPAPDPSEGFQMKVGPFFLRPAGQPGDELEYFTKYEIDLPTNIEVNRVDMQISGYSHHIVVYQFTDQEAADATPPGFRLDANHSDLTLLATAQEAADVHLPQGTAYFWDAGITLDLNSHYINYSANNTYKAEAYINVYTQPAGTAIQEMLTTIVPYPWIYIPNDGDIYSFSDALTYPDEAYLWAIGAHTHKYGTGYKIWKRLPDGEKGDLLYDGACGGGQPGCASPWFDYQHIPVRLFHHLEYIDMSDGIIHEATYINDGPEPVWWGNTSDDEMMLFGVMYVLDTTGLDLPTSVLESPQATLEGVSVFPNPVDQMAVFDFPVTAEAPFQVRLYDVLGEEVHRSPEIQGYNYELDRRGIATGMYMYRVLDAAGQWMSGKLYVE